MKLVNGVGINDADYQVSKYAYILDEHREYDLPPSGKRKRATVWRCPFYSKWVAMLKRCYSLKQRKYYPSYVGCTVDKYWFTFSNFKRWMESQDWEGKQLDKDILIPGNTVYSADTCVFISKRINAFILDSHKAKRRFLLGVTWNRSNNFYQAQCCNPFTGKQEFLGYFVKEKEAHEAWLNRKLELTIELIKTECISNIHVSTALLNRYK